VISLFSTPHCHCPDSDVRVCCVSDARSANWLWLPLRCARPRPSFWLYYPIRESADDEEEDKEEEDGVRPPGSCGQAGCQLPDGHMGLCQVKVQGSRRQAVKERAMVQEQLQRYHEIQTSKEIQAQVAIARADVLKKAEDSGVIIKAPRGNRSQWHAKCASPTARGPHRASPQPRRSHAAATPSLCARFVPR
jgi:hypothetical protein